MSTVRVPQRAPGAAGEALGEGAPRFAVHRFLVATGVSFYGDWLTTVALLVVLYRMTGSAVAPAGYIVARSVARVIGPTPGGALGDRLPPTLVAAGCSGAQALLTLAVVAAVRAGSLWGVYASVVAAQMVGAAARPCLGTIIPGLVPPEGLTRLNALFGAEYSSSIFVAPALGAVLLAHGGARTLLLIDAATFVVAAVLLVTLPLTRDAGAGVRARGGAVDGLRIVLRDPPLRSLAAAYMAGALVITAVQAVLVVAAAQRFGGPGAVGWLYSAVGAGGLVGSATAARRRPARVGAAAILAFAGLEVVAAAAFVTTQGLPLALLLLFVSALSGILYQTWGAVELQGRTAPAVLGRVNAVVVLSMYAGTLLGAVTALALAPRVGWEQCVLIVTGVALVLLGVAGAAPRPAQGVPVTAVR